MKVEIPDHEYMRLFSNINQKQGAPLKDLGLTADELLDAFRSIRTIVRKITDKYYCNDGKGVENFLENLPDNIRVLFTDFAMMCAIIMAELIRTGYFEEDSENKMESFSSENDPLSIWRLFDLNKES